MRTSFWLLPLGVMLFLAGCIAISPSVPTQTLASETPEASVPPVLSTPSIVKVPTSPLCPTEKPGIQPKFDLQSPDLENQVMDYLNEGGSLNLALELLKEISPNADAKDVNGDGAPDLIVDKPSLWVVGCSQGQYEEIYANLEPSEFEGIIAVQDINRDGRAEIVFYDSVAYATATYYRVLGWNGHDLVDLIQRGEDDPAWLNSTEGRNLFWYGLPSTAGDFTTGGSFSSIDLRDLDTNGTTELVISISIRQDAGTLRIGPWRKTREIYRWDGERYSLWQMDIDPPEYRFQAIQDSDRMSNMGRYKEALALYQTAISSDQLYAWSQEAYLKQINNWAEEKLTETPLVKRADEYQQIVAYAYFRIMLLHLVQGDISKAEDTYHTMQHEYPSNPSQPLFSKIAVEFWKEYQSTKSIGQACEMVIETVTGKPEDYFRYLGNLDDGRGSFGDQSHDYLPEDVCPFK